MHGGQRRAAALSNSIGSKPCPLSGVTPLYPGRMPISIVEVIAEMWKVAATSTRSNELARPGVARPGDGMAHRGRLSVQHGSLSRVFISDRGRPTHVLLSIELYQRPLDERGSIVEAVSMSGGSLRREPSWRYRSPERTRARTVL